jgi:pimeloyl-ACP methyl ester carboxylesterase
MVPDRGARVNDVVNAVDLLAPPTTIGHVHDVIGERFSWREAGPRRLGSAEPIVLLHGLGGSRISWEPQLAALSETRRVVAWDLPGYGDSPPLAGPCTFTALADAVAALVADLGAPSVHLVGISFGGMIAQYAAARHPEVVRSLVLLSTSPKFGLDGTRPGDWRAARLAPLDDGLEPGDFAESVLTRLAGPHITPEALHGQVAAMRRISAAGLRRSIECLVTHDSRSLLPTITAPTLCLVGDLDDETPPAYAMAVADLIPHARLSVIAGAGHLLNVEAPDAVDAAILEHIERAAPSGRAREGGHG